MAASPEKLRALGFRKPILIYRIGSLGDTVVALPAIRRIAESFPTARRVMLTNFAVTTRAAPVADVLRNTGLIDEYIEYPLFLRSPRGLWALWNRIRALRPGLLVYLAPARGRMTALRDAAFFRLCGIRTLIGIPYSQKSQSPSLLGNGLYEYEGNRLLRCLASLGGQSAEAPSAFDLGLIPEEYAEADGALSRLGGEPILALSIGAKADVKDWGDANWRALVGSLNERLPGYALVFLGAPVEYSRSAALGSLWSGKVANLCGALSVRGSAAVLERAALYVGHDSGPMHLAAAVGTPCVAIFSSQNLPGEWFPYGKQHRVLYRQIECQGCRLTVCTERNKACIRSITVEEVTAAVLDLLGNPS